MRVYLNKTPRSIAIVSNGFALLLRDIKGQAAKDSSPNCIIEYVPESIVPLNKYIDITPVGTNNNPDTVYALLGVIPIKGMVFVGFITGRSEVGSIRVNERIYQITSTMFVCLTNDSYDYALSQEKIKTYEDFPENPTYSITRLLAGGTFYYSPEFDLVSSFQERGFMGNKSYLSLNSLDDYDGRFAWNCNLIRELISFRNRLATEERISFDTGQFMITIIRGFARTVTVNENEGLLTIISKQDCKKNGPMFGPYCVDDDGNAANFVETEIILTTKDYCMTLIQLSGNVPLFWNLESQLLSTKMEFPRSEDASKHAFNRHFETLIQQHGMVHIIDALSKKGNQQELSQRYKNAIDNCAAFTADQVSYTKIDVSSSFRLKSNDHFLSSLMHELDDPLKTYEAFCYDMTTKTYIGRQSGVFLVNTLNSIERANLIQARISEEVLEYFFKFLNFVPGPEFWTKLNYLWSENGSTLSKMSESYVSSKTKNKTGGIVGKVAEQSKKYVSSQAVVGSSKQNTFDKLLGRLQKQAQVHLFDPIHDYVVEELNKRSTEFTSTKELLIWSGTFNVNAELYEGDVGSWIFPKPDLYQSYDVVFVGLEEVVELTPGKMMNIDASIRVFWEKKLKETLNKFQGDNYTLLRGEQLGGILNLIFVKEESLEHISNVESSVKKTGFKGMSANKGGVAIGFNYSTSRVCFIASHLAAGFHNSDERHQNYKTISAGLKFKQNKTLRDYDSVIWLGDFNFRINLSNEVVRALLHDKSFVVNSANPISPVDQKHANGNEDKHEQDPEKIYDADTLRHSLEEETIRDYLLNSPVSDKLNGVQSLDIDELQDEIDDRLYLQKSREEKSNQDQQNETIQKDNQIKEDKYSESEASVEESQSETDQNVESTSKNIRKHKLAPLFECDQLNLQMASGESFPYFDEMEIKFKPTYKFDKGTSIYDTSEKQRVPAWTDRILSLSRSPKIILNQVEYNSVPELKFSDHRPVYGIFKAKVDMIDENIRSTIEKQLYESRKLAIGGVNSLVLTLNINESSFLLKHGLPAPSGKTTKSRWWMSAGTGKVKIRFPELDSGEFIINPNLPKNPFVETDEPDFISARSNTAKRTADATTNDVNCDVVRHDENY